MTHLDLFTGIGGFHIAAEWSGFESVGFSEIEPYCCKLLTQHWPGIKNYGDIRTADFGELRGTITVLSAGVPCQPASIAGKRRGEKDDRWLWTTAIDVVESVKPAWCIFENPPGILTLDEFGPILLRLESLGYEIRGFNVPANAVGADTEGYRVFIVGAPNCERWEWRRTERTHSQETGSHRETAGSNQAPCAMAASLCEGLEASRIQVGHGEKVSPTGRTMPEHVWLPTDPRIYGSFDGIPNRAHRIKALGNSVVPQQAYPFFETIAQVEGMR